MKRIDSVIFAISIMLWLVSAPAAAVITIDGDISDWANVPDAATDTAFDFVDSACGYNTYHRDVTKVKFASDAQNLYYFLELGPFCYPYNGLQIYFDTDS